MNLNEKQARVLSKVANQEPTADDEKSTLSKLRRYGMVMENTKTGWLWDRDSDDYLHTSDIGYDWVMTGKGEKKLREYQSKLARQLENLSSDVITVTGINGRVYKPEHTHEEAV
jgi:hypothetical protein